MKSTAEKYGKIFFIVAIVVAAILYGKSWTAIDIFKGTTGDTLTYNGDVLSDESLDKLRNQLQDAGKYDYVGVKIMDENTGAIKFTFNQNKYDLDKFVTMCSDAAFDTAEIVEKYKLKLGSVFVYQSEDNSYIAWTSKDGVKGDLGYQPDAEKQSSEDFKYLTGVTPDQMRKNLEAGDIFTTVR